MKSYELFAREVILIEREISLDITKFRVDLDQAGNCFRGKKFTKKSEQNDDKMIRFRSGSKQRCICCPIMH